MDSETKNHHLPDVNPSTSDNVDLDSTNNASVNNEADFQSNPSGWQMIFAFIGTFGLIGLGVCAANLNAGESFSFIVLPLIGLFLVTSFAAACMLRNNSNQPKIDWAKVLGLGLKYLLVILGILLVVGLGVCVLSLN